MQQNISKLASMVIGLVFALSAAAAFAQGPMMGPEGPGPMTGGPGGYAATHCERVGMPMPHRGAWGERGGMWRHSMRHHRGRDRMMMDYRMMHALKLTDEQRNQMRDIIHKARMENWKTRGDIMDAQFRMRALYRTDQPDPRKVGEVFTQISNFKREMLETRLRARNKIWNLLTSEQQKQVHDWKHHHWHKRVRSEHREHAMQ